MSIIIDRTKGDTRAFDAASIGAAARQIAGVEPDEPLRFMDGFAHLTSSLDTEARLTDAGRRSARAALVKSLVTQLEVRRMLRSQPELAQTPIQPIVITGLLRSGTTFLQQLLAQHPGLRAPALWELMAPASPRKPSHLVADGESYVEEYYRAAPDFRSIHPLDARQPEECHRLTANSFRHFIFGLRYRVPSYVRWLRAQPMAEAYRFHREQLSCLLAREPGDPVLLKCPSHLWHLDALAQVYPGAKVVRLHRRASVSLPSVASLTAVVRAARSAAVDPAEIGAYWLEEAAPVLDSMRRGVGPLRTPPLDIRFTDLTADPLRVAGQVCDYAGVPMTEQATARMTAFLSGATGKPGNHRYRAQDFGLSAQLLDERFARYHSEFDL
ncbi:sulfotransferase family protein [Rhizocola hellebori]|uniref:sulfotransferase family protein n=1 Tax=Rhizocola hellebori TaxID=1392758 RepID=UPI001EF2C220|nr:sulfotransferase [Rhizocola hellebori]